MSAPESGVYRWPDNESAALALRAHLERLEHGEESKLDGYRLDFRGAILQVLKLNGANFAEACLDGVSFRGCTLNRADFTDASLQGACFDDVEMIGADLYGVLGKKATFVNAWLSGLEALNADLREANFQQASLRGVGFDGANLEGADFRSAKFERTLFISSRILGVQLAGATGTLVGPSDVAEDQRLADADLQAWFCERGADVTIVPVVP
ncbi:pentapeptide repeat-containing protein [Actinomadura sp. 9N407]|uniref:pentapeptide repeat-containing protein n=1 Tax=Actinomadura sp. 9N407 TaxID=3375154 RepID=UPI003788B43F